VHREQLLGAENREREPLLGPEIVLAAFAARGRALDDAHARPCTSIAMSAFGSSSGCAFAIITTPVCSSRRSISSRPRRP